MSPPSPACGLRPVTAILGRGRAEARLEIARHHAHRVADQGLRHASGHARQRHVDRRGHHREGGRPEQHHGLPGGAEQLAGHGAHELRLAGVGIADAVEDLLRDRVGDHGGGLARRDELDAPAHGGDGAWRVGRVGVAGPSQGFGGEGNDRQRFGKGGGGLARRDEAEAHGQAESLRHALAEGQVRHQEKRVGIGLPAQRQPSLERDLHTDAGGIAAREGQRAAEGRSRHYRLSITARLRISFRRATASRS